MRRQEVVVPGLVPGIHVLCTARQGVDGRDKPGHDDVEASAPQPFIVVEPSRFSFHDECLRSRVNLHSLRREIP
jgi:hypothetical protein